MTEVTSRIAGAGQRDFAVPIALQPKEIRVGGVRTASFTLVDGTLSLLNAPTQGALIEIFHDGARDWNSHNLNPALTAPGTGSVTRTPQDKILDFPLTPLDFITDPALKAAVRNGTNTTGDTSAAYKACIEAALAFGNARQNIVVKITEPAGAYVWDKKVYVDLDKGGRTNGLMIERAGRFASKHYTGPNNKYRFVNKGYYDAAANTPLIDNTPGNAYLVSKESGNWLNTNRSVNVGDWIYVKADGTYQIILAESRYRGYVDLSYDPPRNSFGLPLFDPQQCQYGDTYVVEQAGNFQGTYLYRGDEIFFLAPGVWRRKNVLGSGGSYVFNMGERDLGTQGFPTGVTAGNYFVVMAPTGRMAGIPQSRYVNGMMQECSSFRAGDKICWTGNYWQKIWASPTPRGGINADGSCSKPRVWNTTKVAFEYDGSPLEANRGSYGTYYYLAKDTANTICGIPGPHKEDEVFFFDSFGWSKLGRDPNWDVGMLHFSGDLLDHAITIRGGHTDISMLSGTSSGEGAEQEYNNGILYRFCGRRSPVNDGGLFSDEGVVFEGANLSSDDPDAGKAQFKMGLVEKHVYCRGVSSPVVRNYHAKIASGFNREVYNVRYPRVGVGALHFHNCGFVRMLDVSANARFRTGFHISSDIWDVVAGSDWEGGQFDGSWAECIDGLRLDHGYRNELPTEPTFEIHARDTKSLRYGIIINGHCHVVITGSVPIIEENYKADGTGSSVNGYAAAIRIEKADNVIISGSVPNGGFDNSYLPDRPADVNAAWRAAFLRVHGTVGTVYINTLILSMNAGVGIDATYADRRTLARDFPAYTPPGEALPVSVNDCSIVVDGFTMDGLYGVSYQGYRVLRPVIDPAGIVATRGIHREGPGPRAAHTFTHTCYTSTAQYDPILSIDRARSDNAVYQSGELGRLRFRGLDTSGVLRDVHSITTKWAGDSTASTGSASATFSIRGAGSSKEYMLVDAPNNRITHFLDAQFNGAKFGAFGAAPVVKPTVSGATQGNPALQSLIVALASLGWINSAASA